MRRSATLRQLPAEERKAADICADYLLTYRETLDYSFVLLLVINALQRWSQSWHR